MIRSRREQLYATLFGLCTACDGPLAPILSERVETGVVVETLVCLWCHQPEPVEFVVDDDWVSGNRTPATETGSQLDSLPRSVPPR